MRRIFSIFRKFAATIFSRVITKKPSKIVKSSKIHLTLLNTYLTWPKRNRVKLAVPPNLLKQENVFLIPREPEHPSKLFVGKQLKNTACWKMGFKRVFFIALWDSPDNCTVYLSLFQGIFFHIERHLTGLGVVSSQGWWYQFYIKFENCEKNENLFLKFWFEINFRRGKFRTSSLREFVI